MSAPPTDPRTDGRTQRRIVAVLSAGQALSGVGIGAGASVGALLLARVADDEALSGLAATAGTLGAAVFAIPLAHLASRRGRRPALGSGAAVAVGGALAVLVSAALGSPLLLGAALLVLGAGNAVNLQARFAATDLAAPEHRGRDLSVVVWMTTIGIVIGPNLVGPGQELGALLGLPDLTGPFLITAGCQLAASALYLTSLRPDPLRASLRSAGGADVPRRGGQLAAYRAAGPRARRAIGVVALSQATMVAVMAMTPVHLAHHGASLSIIGLTISLHTLGMFGLSPVFGWLSDRWGRERVALIGQGLFVVALGIGWVGAESMPVVTIGLAVLGLGWSASTIAGSALVAGAAAPADRAAIQGLSDLAMSLSGALGGALAGIVLALVGFAGLNAVTLVLVAVAVALLVAVRAPSPAARSRALRPR